MSKKSLEHSWNVFFLKFQGTLEVQKLLHFALPPPNSFLLFP